MKEVSVKLRIHFVECFLVSQSSVCTLCGSYNVDAVQKIWVISKKRSNAGSGSDYCMPCG